MVVALLAVLGVDLIVVVALAAVVLSRRRWVSRRPGAFRGAVRLSDGEFPGFRRRWKRGYGRWVSAVLVWTPAPFMLRNELVAAGPEAPAVREAGPADRVKRLGRGPVIVAVAADGACIEIAAAADGRERALGPFADSLSGAPAGTSE